MAERKCKACGRKVTELDEFCIIHAVDSSFVEKVRAVMIILDEEKAAKKKTPGGKK